MATTTGSTSRMVPFSGEGSTIASEMDYIELSGTVAVGDVLTIDAGVDGALEDNTEPPVAVGSTPAGVVGVAMEAGVDGDVIQYAPAYPGRTFEANIINNVTDIAAPTTNALLQNMYGIGESADGFACLDTNSAVEVTMPRGWGRQMLTPYEGRRWSPPSVINPRILFVFASSVFVLSA